MISRFEIITTSIRPSTTSMMLVSSSVVMWVTRCQTSFRNNTTYTPCATIRPRYNGTWSQRLMKMTAGSGFMEGRGGRGAGMFGDADMSGAGSWGVGWIG